MCHNFGVKTFEREHIVNLQMHDYEFYKSLCLNCETHDPCVIGSGPRARSIRRSENV